MKKTMKKFAAVIAAISMLSTSLTFTSASAASVSYKLGDVNLDGVVDEQDSDMLRQSLWGRTKLTEVQRTTADVNGDLHVNYKDLTAVIEMCNGKTRSADIQIDVDENNNVLHYINNNPALSVSSTGWMANVTNSANNSNLEVSPYTFSYSSNGSKMMLTPWGADFSKGSSGIYFSNYGTSAISKFKDGLFTTYYSPDGKIYDYNSYLSKNECGIMRKIANFFANTSVDDQLFAPSDYGMNGTVHLAGADVTKLENGYEFINNISDETVYSFLGHDFAVMDDVTFYYRDGEFTFEGIDESSIETIYTGQRDGYEEIAVITDRYIYGLMYEPPFDMMAAFVRYDRLKDEAALAQYTSIVDMATVSIHYAQEGVVEYGLEHPELMVKWLDDYYDPDHMVFETIMYSQGMKCIQVGKMNDAYKIYDGLTYTQLPTGVNTIVKNHEDETSTLMFGSGIFNISNNSGGAFTTRGIYQYTSGGDTFMTTPGNDTLYSPDANITYAYNGGAANFKVTDVLNNRTPSMY